jgi:hypothetical protein
MRYVSSQPDDSSATYAASSDESDPSSTTSMIGFAGSPWTTVEPVCSRRTSLWSKHPPQEFGEDPLRKPGRWILTIMNVPSEIPWVWRRSLGTR